MSNEITNGWQRLMEDPQPNRKTLIYPDSDRDLYLVLRSVSPQVRVFYMVTRTDAAQNLPELPQVNAFEVSVAPEESAGYSRIEIALFEMEYENHFNILIGDICNSVEVASTDRDAIYSFLDSIVMWQQFIAKGKIDVLSEEKRRGLVGELLCLRDMIIPEADVSRALEAWTGPVGDSQSVRDFEYAGVGVEVKTTASRRPQRFSVSSERQLDDSQIRSIVIYHVSLEVGLTTGESLYGLVEDIRTLIPDAISRVLFEKRLYDYGYSDEYEEIYKQWRYSVRDQTLFLVSDGFPRIVEDNLSTGISNVRYDVGIEQCEDFKIESADFFKLFSVS